MLLRPFDTVDAMGGRIPEGPSTKGADILVLYHPWDWQDMHQNSRWDTKGVTEFYTPEN